MRQHLGTTALGAAPVAVLSVSPFAEDHLFLKAIAVRSGWKLFEADRLPVAMDLLRRETISAVLCERDLRPHTWADLLEITREAARPAPLIVTSRLADDRLWAEALNLGAWDVLAKPFDGREVVREVRSAWLHWRDRAYLQANSLQVHRAAS